MTHGGERIMSAGALHTWTKRRLTARRRLGRICTAYLLFLMVVTTKHSLKEAARFSGRHSSLVIFRRTQYPHHKNQHVPEKSGITFPMQSTHANVDSISDLATGNG